MVLVLYKWNWLSPIYLRKMGMERADCLVDLPSISFRLMWWVKECSSFILVLKFEKLYTPV